MFKLKPIYTEKIMFTYVFKVSPYDVMGELVLYVHNSTLRYEFGIEFEHLIKSIQK